MICLTCDMLQKQINNLYHVYKLQYINFLVLLVHYCKLIYYPAVRMGSSTTRFFHYFPFFWWSLAPDLWFSLGQRNTRRVFHYTAKGFYPE